MSENFCGAAARANPLTTTFQLPAGPMATTCSTLLRWSVPDCECAADRSLLDTGPGGVSWGFTTTGVPHASAEAASVFPPASATVWFTRQG